MQINVFLSIKNYTAMTKSRGGGSLSLRHMLSQVIMTPDSPID